MVKFYLKKDAKWEFLENLGYTRDTKHMTGFYVKKFSKRGKTQLYIDLFGILSEKNRIVWNDENKKQPIWPHIQDLLNYGLVYIDVGQRVMDLVEYLEYREYNFDAIDFYILSQNKKYVKVSPSFFTDLNIGDYYVANTEYEPHNKRTFDAGLTKLYLNRKF